MQQASSFSRSALELVLVLATENTDDVTHYFLHNIIN